MKVVIKKIHTTYFDNFKSKTIAIDFEWAFIKFSIEIYLYINYVEVRKCFISLYSILITKIHSLYKYSL
jgi:hypothetical protein